MAEKGTVIKKIAIIMVLVILVGSLGFYIHYKKNKNALPQDIVTGNGRLEATEVDICTKPEGRLAEVLVKEGDMVTAGQIVAKMDASGLEAQLRQAQAEVKRLQRSRQTATSKVESIRLRLNLAVKELARVKSLLGQGIATQQQYDRELTTKEALEAEYAAAQSLISEADAAIESAVALTERIRVEIDDAMMKSPINGPVLTRLTEPGEVLPKGGKVLTIIDPTDIYMNVYLSDALAGSIPLGGDAKVVFDAIKDRSFKARVAYVSERAQFTPKEVETMEERQKLVFRVTISLSEFDDPRLKPGMPGVAYIKLSPNAQWPVACK